MVIAERGSGDRHHPPAPAGDASTATAQTVRVSQDAAADRPPRARQPQPLDAGRSRNMQANRRVNTKPEVRLRSALHRAGYRFRRDLRVEASELRVRPDIVFTRHKVAVFVDGCFWHVCPVHGRQPTRNEWYWTPKLRRNVERDRHVDAALEGAGWTVVRVWEHEPLDEALRRVVLALAHADEARRRH